MTNDYLKSEKSCNNFLLWFNDQFSDIYDEYVGFIDFSFNDDIIVRQDAKLTDAEFEMLGKIVAKYFAAA